MHWPLRSSAPARRSSNSRNVERIPILRMGEFLLVTIQVDMHDQMALKLQDDLSNAIVRNASRGVLIDISTLEMVDSFIGRMVADISNIGKILGAETIVVGMQPAVAITLVELGLSLPGVSTALNVEKGMALIGRAVGKAEGTNGGPEIVAVRQVVREWAVTMGFSLVDQTKIVTAASELARNVVVYGGGGTLSL